MMYELILKGFDGSTDETDDKIIWINIPDNMEVTSNANGQIESVSELSFIGGIPGPVPHADLTIKKREG